MITVGSSWMDVDLPAVAELRRTLFPPHPRRRLVSASVTEAGWTSILGDLRGPTFVVAEGLLMYLERAQVFQLARDLAEVQRGGPAEFAYDYYCAQMVGQAWLNSSLRRLGAEFKWGLACPEELSLGEPRWRVIDTHPVMERLGWPYDHALVVVSLVHGRSALWHRPFAALGRRPRGMRVEGLKEDRGNRDRPTASEREADRYGNGRCLCPQLFTRT